MRSLMNLLEGAPAGLVSSAFVGRLKEIDPTATVIEKADRYGGDDVVTVTVRGRTFRFVHAHTDFNLSNPEKYYVEENGKTLKEFGKELRVGQGKTIFPKDVAVKIMPQVYKWFYAIAS